MKTLIYAALVAGALAAWRGAPGGLPLRERFGRDPQRQTPEAAQARFILRPVRRVLRHLRDVMPKIGIVLTRHASLQNDWVVTLLPRTFIDLSLH